MPELIANRYDILSELGRGGFATVYHARDVRLNRDVALKILNPALGGDPRLRELFHREAQTAAGLKHPHIATIYDTGEADDRLFIIMELLHGLDLRRKIERDGALPLPLTVSVIEQIASALDYAHGHGIIHRDVKAANIIVDDAVHATLTDFGLVRAIESSTYGSSLSMSGGFVGSVEYIPPELVNGEKATPLSDQYSLGVVAYEMVTGQLPFKAETPIAVAVAHSNRIPRDPRELRSDLPQGMGAAILRVMSKQPAERFATTMAFAATLHEELDRPAKEEARRSAGAAALEAKRQQEEVHKKQDVIAATLATQRRSEVEGSDSSEIAEAAIVTAATSIPSRATTKKIVFLPLLLGGLSVALLLIALILLSSKSQADAPTPNPVVGSDASVTTATPKPVATTQYKYYSLAIGNANDESYQNTDEVILKWDPPQGITALGPDEEYAVTIEYQDVTGQMLGRAFSTTSPQFTLPRELFFVNDGAKPVAKDGQYHWGVSVIATVSNTYYVGPISPETQPLYTFYWKENSPTPVSSNSMSVTTEAISTASPTAVVCPGGSFWDANVQRCSYDSSVEPTSVACPSGQFWDAVMQRCKGGGPTVEPTSVACLPGQFWDAVIQRCKGDGPAVEPTSVACPPGQFWDPTMTKCKNESLGIGSTQVTDKDGMTLLYVPAGEFIMGSNSGNPDEKPPHTIYLDAFWIDQTEVTNAMFQNFVNSSGYKTDAEKQGSGYSFDPAGKTWNDVQGTDWLHPQEPTSSWNGLDNHPVVQVSWNDAMAYCQWAGRRLPTEAEWEKAARGTDGRIYPWGNQPVAGNLANFADRNLNVDWADKNVNDGYQFTAPVDYYPVGASPYGALDMAGNVWEWTADWYDAAYYARSPARNPKGATSSDSYVVRGGGWENLAFDVRVSFRINKSPDYRTDHVGFRCAMSAQ